MTEWGNPWGRESPTSAGEHIACRGETQGTEPSKYLEEKKTRSDSLSSGERRGKSLNLSCARCAPLHGRGYRAVLEGVHEPSQSKKPRVIVECHWEGRPERVKVPYTKWMRLCGHGT